MVYINEMKVETIKVKYEAKPEAKPVKWPRWLMFFAKKVTVTPEIVVWEEAFPWP